MKYLIKKYLRPVYAWTFVLTYELVTNTFKLLHWSLFGKGVGSFASFAVLLTLAITIYSLGA